MALAGTGSTRSYTGQINNTKELRFLILPQIVEKCSLPLEWTVTPETSLWTPIQGEEIFFSMLCIILSGQDWVLMYLILKHDHCLAFLTVLDLMCVTNWSWTSVYTWYSMQSALWKLSYFVCSVKFHNHQHGHYCAKLHQDPKHLNTERQQLRDILE